MFAVAHPREKLKDLVAGTFSTSIEEAPRSMAGGGRTRRSRSSREARDQAGDAVFLHVYVGLNPQIGLVKFVRVNEGISLMT